MKTRYNKLPGISRHTIPSDIFKVTLFSVFMLLMMSIMFEGCKKFVQIDPPVTSITAATAYSTNGGAAAVMSGIYTQMVNSTTGLSDGYKSVGFLQGMGADELKYYGSDPVSIQFYANSLNSSNAYYWTELYKQIHVADAVIEGLANAPNIVTMKPQLLGEAKFMRAFLHFYAVNLYGDVPLVTTTNYLTNNTISRTPSMLVYQQIIQDLKDAKGGLSDSYLDYNGNKTTAKIRPNKGAAEALLSRVYLYAGKADSAAIEATNVINSSAGYVMNSDLTQVFKMNSSEAIWQIQPVFPGTNTFDGYYFILTGSPGSSGSSGGVTNTITLSNNLVNAFELGDKRLANWVGVYTSGSTNYYYPYKYRVNAFVNTSIPVTEYLMVLRLAEQYLIRAEAEANGAGGGVPAGIADLNIVRNRAGLANTTANDKTTLLAAIAHERQVELFTEWGHRWFDLKRTNMLNTVMPAVTALKGGNWDPHSALLPLPISELQANSNLTQNPGY